MKKLIGALGDIVDESKRKFIKQAGALGAIAATPKVVRKMAGEVPAQKVFKELPVDIRNVPVFEKLNKEALQSNFIQNLEWLDADEALEIITDISEETGKSFKQLGVDPKNVNPKDLMGDELMKEIDLENFHQYGWDELDWLYGNKDLKNWAEGKVELDDVEQDLQELLKSLMDDYGLNKQQVLQYFGEQGVELE